MRLDGSGCQKKPAQGNLNGFGGDKNILKSHYESSGTKSNENFNSEAINAFCEQLISDGFLPPPKKIVSDGEWHRFYLPGGSKNNVDAAYSIKINCETATGCYLSYRNQDEKFHFHFGKMQTFIERYISLSDADPNHPYLLKKQIPANGFKQDENKRLVVPMCDQTGQCCGLQYISADGSKKIAYGSIKAGSRLDIKGDESIVYIVEGVVTGLSVHQATGNKVVVAWDEGNLKNIGPFVQECHPNSRIVFAADNDCKSKKNIGVQSALKAAEAIGADVVIPEMPDGSKCDWNDIHLKIGIAEVTRQLIAASQEKTNGSPFKLVHVGELVIKPIDWLVKDFLETDSFTLLFGDPGTYKSFLSIAFACCVASGKDFLGRKVKQGASIYIAGEGQNGLARRFMAWSIRNGVDLKDIPLFVSSAPTGLCDTDQTKFVMDAISGIVAEYGEPALIVVDTVARNFGPGDENSTPDMSGFVASCDLLRSQYGATVLLVHHCGLSDKTRSRGNMALKAALDAEYRLDQDESGVIRFEATKMKDAPEPPPVAFRAAVVELGIYDGEMVTSLVLNGTSYEPPAKQGKEGRGKWQTVAVEVLENLQDAAEQRLENSGYDPNTARVSVENWRTACADEGIKDRRIWKKVKDTLTRQETVTIENGFVSIC